MTSCRSESGKTVDMLDMLKIVKTHLRIETAPEFCAMPYWKWRGLLVCIFCCLLAFAQMGGDSKTSSAFLFKWDYTGSEEP